MRWKDLALQMGAVPSSYLFIWNSLNTCKLSWTLCFYFSSKLCLLLYSITQVKHISLTRTPVVSECIAAAAFSYQFDDMLIADSCLLLARELGGVRIRSTTPAPVASTRYTWFCTGTCTQGKTVVCNNFFSLANEISRRWQPAGRWHIRMPAETTAESWHLPWTCALPVFDCWIYRLD